FREQRDEQLRGGKLCNRRLGQQLTQFHDTCGGDDGLGRDSHHRANSGKRQGPSHTFRSWSMKIAISAISKNESLHVDRFCEAAKDSDLISVCDTGSTDNTVDLLLENGATVHLINIDPWRFDDARNAALALLPADIDVVISLDLDEILQPGWREEIERVWVPGTTRLRYGFDWGCGIVFKYEN